jgi:DNA-binding MarR family transcriptional regulator
VAGYAAVATTDRRRAQALGLTHVQFVLLLASLWWLTQVTGEEPSQRRVAEHAGTDPMMTSQVLRVLTSKGLIARERTQMTCVASRLGAAGPVSVRRVRAPPPLPGEDARTRPDTSR